MEAMMLIHGGSIGYYRGDVKTATLDMQALRPTIMPIVPRLLNKMYDTAQAMVRMKAIAVAFSWTLPTRLSNFFVA